MSVMKTLTYGPDAWQALKGIFCVYKPSGLSVMNVRDTLCFNLCRDLNEMEQRDAHQMISLKGSVCSKEPFKVEVVPNYSDHQLVSGPHYQEQDIRMSWICKLGRHVSGVLLIAVNDGCWEARRSVYKYLLRRYQIKGKFGIATKNFMSDGIVTERSTYYHVKQASLDRILASIQASHQSLAYQYSGVNIHSQKAYELASSGLVKPSDKTNPLIYSIKCSEFNLPHFTLDVHCINETQEFLAEVVHDIGIDLKTTAVCTQLRQVQFGQFLLPHALLRKHWTLENILNNLTICQGILSQHSDSTDFQSIKALKQNDFVENMRRKAREECI